MSDPDTILNTSPDYTVTHVFSINDIAGGFDGATVADTPSIIDLTADPKEVKDAPPLYPIDSEFGFYVTDFDGAEEKVRDGLYEEGWAGNLTDGSGLVVSDAPTDTFQTPAVLGTWLAGLGGNSVKASTEHYSVMQNVLSDQAYPGDTDAVYQLDDDLRMMDLRDGALVHDSYVLELTQALQRAIDNVGTGTTTHTDIDFDRDGVNDTFDTFTVTAPGTDIEVGVVDLDQDGEWDLIDRGLNGYGSDAGIQDILLPNESSIQYDIAYGDDYSVTLKDDGKLLYRWGNMVKRPNDVRLEVELKLPSDWSKVDPETGLLPLYRVTEAELATNHTITNNPNDQIRPEGLENEAAIGTLPTYEEDMDGNWVSTQGFYTGDGTFYPAGTVLKDVSLPGEVDGSILDQIGATSEDLEEGFTNEYYTTMDRAPFTADLDEDGAYVSGPRWRLQTDKYGQDLPSVVIPIDPSTTANPTNAEVKYEVGDDTLTVLNLLDWETDVSPLSLSAGYQNNAGTVDVNGLNLTSNFDLAFYVKGDSKPATLYDTQLIMSYEELAIHAEDSVVVGGAGDDYLVGMGGNTFTGDSGSDLFVLSYGSSAGDVFNVSTITDFTAGEDVIGLIGLGADTVELDTALPDTNISQALVTGGLELFLDGNQIAFLSGVDTLLEAESFFTATQSATNTIIGTAGDDVLTGTKYTDIIWAQAGNDTVYGLESDDIIGGGAGDDVLWGGSGDDTIYGSTGLDEIYGEDGDDLIYAGTDNDTVDGGAGDDTIYAFTGDDQVLGGDGADVIGGGAGDDTLSGGLGDDTIYGSAGADTVSGDGGDDLLFGGADNDTVDGGAGSDEIYGGAGNDTLTGGADADSFMFLLGFGDDSVTDFTLAEDTLGFDETLWGGGLTEAQVVGAFASVVGSDVVFDFGASSVTLLGLTTTTGLESDIVFL